MRDPLRIDRVLSLIAEKWKQYPDLRLGQLLINACPRFETIGYQVEEPELEAGLKAFPKAPGDPKEGTR